MAKYFTHPRRIGLIFSITPPTGWEPEAPKISLSLPSQAVRFLPFGNSSGIHRPRRLRIRRNSNPRNPKLPPCCRSTLRLFPHSPPLAVWPTPPVAVSPPPAEAIAGAAANLPGSPDHRRTLRIRCPGRLRGEKRQSRPTRTDGGDPL